MDGESPNFTCVDPNCIRIHNTASSYPLFCCLLVAGPEWRRHCVRVLRFRDHQELPADQRWGAGQTQGIRIHRVRDTPVCTGRHYSYVASAFIYMYVFLCECCCAFLSEKIFSPNICDCSGSSLLLLVRGASVYYLYLIWSKDEYWNRFIKFVNCNGIIRSLVNSQSWLCPWKFKYGYGSATMIIFFFPDEL